MGGTGQILYRTRDGVRINLAVLDDEERLALQEKEFGFVGGVRRLPADLSIVGHVARDLVASQALTAAEARHKAQQALESFDIGPDLLHESGRALPEELQTRVELVRALTKAPRLLLLDEPAKLLPESLHQQLLSRLRELCAAGTATLMASRSTWLLEELADEVLELPSRDSVGAVA
jgi:ABC-type glutathione transport system ATPase component